VQGIGALWKLTPSVFVRCHVPGATPPALPWQLFRCPKCAGRLVEQPGSMDCESCGLRWPVTHGLYDFKQPMGG
jgi:hypothetical protein